MNRTEHILRSGARCVQRRASRAGFGTPARIRPPGLRQRPVAYHRPAPTGSSMASVRSSLRSRCTSYLPSRSSLSGSRASPNACSRISGRLRIPSCGPRHRSTSPSMKRRRPWASAEAGTSSSSSSSALVPSSSANKRNYLSTTTATALRASLSSTRIACRQASASALYRPCFQGIAIPRPAPRYLPRRHASGSAFRLTAGDRHGLPLRVRAPHRGLWCMGELLCMGLILISDHAPPPGG